jgi:hypothetical protein
MCTITFIARRQGYVLGMNRDEKLSRVTALRPAKQTVGIRSALFPSEPNGGTWIGVNDAGASFALINWYSINARVVGETISRGEVVKAALPFDTIDSVNQILTEWALFQVSPFRLIGIVPVVKTVVEWRWNLQRLDRVDHPWRTNTWISSGFDEPGAQQTRGRIFGEALRQRSAGTGEWLRRLHRSHRPERGPYSTCMHREDAVTVSFTEVTVSRRTAAICYSPGAPCCTPPLPIVSLRLNP